MKVCLRAIPSGLSRGIHRVARALEDYKPDWVTVVKDPKEADLWVLHVIGHGSMEEFDATLARGARVAMIQYCLRTTENPSAEAWLPYWNRAELVMSYYDLAAYAGDSFKFMYTSLGVDTEVFQPCLTQKKLHVIGTSGTIAATEGVKEANDAALRLSRRQLHLGPKLALGPNVTYVTGVTDTQLAALWTSCDYVAGLRRIEGFELPALEGLACGARPVCFDAPHYRQWFGEHAEYIPEVAAEDVTEALVELFRRPVRPVMKAERMEVARKYAWEPIASRFWEGIQR
jgi:glycosyltransferase involved in cell wall biosynthesis